MAQTFSIDASHPMPLYAQLERSIRFAIVTGRLGLGEQLPTVRQMAVDLRINANTVAKVYTELERTGIVETRRGVGTFVKARHFEAAGEKDREGEWRELENHSLSRIAILGFSAEQAVDHLKDRLKRQK